MPPFLSASELPPKPDSSTGEPRPPRAPEYSKSSTKPKEQDKDRISDPSHAPAPPDGQGPVLVWYKPSRRKKWGVGVTGFVMIVLGITVLQGFDLRWMTFWQVWLVVIIGALLIGGSVRSATCAAGAEWLKAQGSWVRLYELKKITAHYRSNAIHLDFEDRDGRVVQTALTDLQEDRDLWDLVYNGILHSVVAGDAETNGRLHSALDVPRPWPQD